MFSNQHLFQFLIIVVLMGLSGIGWVLRKLREQAELRRIQQEGERRRLESLRTGRPMEEDAPRAVPQASAQRQLQELAARRAAQLQELRRLQQARQRSATGQGAPVRTAGAPSRPRPVEGVLVSIPGSTGPTVAGTRPPRRGFTPQAPPTARRAGPAARSTPEQGEYNRKRARQEAAKAQQVKQAGRTQRAIEARETQRREASRPPTEVPRDDYPRKPAEPPAPAPETREVRRPIAKLFRGMSRADLRRAFIVQEVFGPPISLRRGSEQPSGPFAPMT